jgi:hypothetical protein
VPSSIGWLARSVSWPTPFRISQYPLGELEPLRAAAEQKGSLDFTPLWSGQAAALSREMPAAMLTRIMVTEALERLHRLRCS